MTRTEELLERGVLALEKLASDPQVEIEAGEPMCPHCGKIDPEIKIGASEEGQGQLSEYVFVPTCLNCGERFWVMIESYATYQSLESLTIDMNARRADDGN